MRQLELVQKTFFSYIVQNWPWPESFHCLEDRSKCTEDEHRWIKWIDASAPSRSRAVRPISGMGQMWHGAKVWSQTETSVIGPRFEDLDCMERAVREARVKSNLLVKLGTLCKCFASETAEVKLVCQMNPNLWRGKSVTKEDSRNSRSCQIMVNVCDDFQSLIPYAKSQSAFHVYIFWSDLVDVEYTWSTELPTNRYKTLHVITCLWVMTIWL